MALGLTNCAILRRGPLLSFLARSYGLLRCQHIGRGRFGQEEVRAGTGGLLRVLAPQEGGRPWRSLMEDG